MKFGPTPTHEAEGAILVHSVALKGRKLKKGRILSAGDLEVLVAAGVDSVIAARLDEDDVGEDEAATLIAKAACGDGVRLQAAFTGRCNLYADRRGVAVMDRARIDALNIIDEAVTIATVEPYEVVEAGQMLATVKIIPFGAPNDAVTRAVRVAAADTPLMTVAAFRPHKAGLIMTELPDTKARTLDKTAEVVAERLRALGSSLERQVRCAHAAGAIAGAISELSAAGCEPILIFGASAITDRRDEIPTGIETAGGRVEHFGMPVDPGNLLLLGRLGDGYVIGLPGCARSPKLNGFDWVLQRVLAGLPVGAADIMRMGAGGLLKEIPLRPQPRTAETPDEELSSPRIPRISAIVLAAGQSRRMGSSNKLLAEVDGKPMVQHALDAALAVASAEVVVVTGHQRNRVEAALADAKVRFAHNADYERGLSTSLKTGFAALSQPTDGVIVLLGDMPRIRASHLERLIAAFNPVEGRSLCVPTYKGKRGNPVLFSASFAAEIGNVEGDVGARHIIGQHEDSLAEVPMPDDAIFVDVDTPDALTAIREAG